MTTSFLANPSSSGPMDPFSAPPHAPSSPDPVARHLAALLEPDPHHRSLLQTLLTRLLTAVADGHTAIPLTPSEHQFLVHRPYVATDLSAPLVLTRHHLQFQRHAKAEQELLERLERHRAHAKPSPILPAATSFPPHLTQEQRAAIAQALAAPLTILTGGPGSGKTTTLAALLAIALESHPHLTVALAAPTGKAADRLTHALNQHRRHLSPHHPLFQRPLTASTLHALLGLRPNAPRRLSILPHHLVIIDEASMLSLHLALHLAEALSPFTRLILVGDPHQLPAVEAGTVLVHLIERFPDLHRQLTRSHRFTLPIADLAVAIRLGDSSAAASLLSSSPAIDRLTHPRQLLHALLRHLSPYCDLLLPSLSSSPPPLSSPQLAQQLLTAVSKTLILTPLREGPYGVIALNARLIRLLTRSRHLYPLSPPPAAHGLPILITVNYPPLRLANGDTGVILYHHPYPLAYFPDPDHPDRLRTIPLPQLPPWEPAFALTVHKAQGSEYDRLLLILPPQDHPLLTRELLYTAVTRAKTHLTLYDPGNLFLTALTRTARRLTMPALL
ncbi:MAG: exodeoxyribonuclease V subunit alpha [Hydrogenophilus sp.]|nr:exodeoxyribonuclease V subunit alpha [Hydrogenophilus sp.]